MVRKNFWICLFLLVCRSVLWGQLNGQAENAVGVQSEDSLMEALGTIPAFTIYKDNYVVTGTSFKGGKITKYNSDAKFQISLRHRLFRNLLPFRLYVFLTYTQLSFWNIYRESEPFAETNYNPTLGVGRNFIRRGRIEGIGMIQFEHESNGRDSIQSRSWNRLTFTGIYMPDANFSFQVKAWIAMMFSRYNPHLTQYAGIGHVGMTYVNRRNRFQGTVLMIKRGGWNLNANWRLGIAYRLFRRDNQFLYLQFYNGYGERMLEYNRFCRYLRIGFMIKPHSVSIF